MEFRGPASGTKIKTVMNRLYVTSLGGRTSFPRTAYELQIEHRPSPKVHMDKIYEVCAFQNQNAVRHMLLESFWIKITGRACRPWRHGYVT